MIGRLIQAACDAFLEVGNNRADVTSGCVACGTDRLESLAPGAYQCLECGYVGGPGYEACRQAQADAALAKLPTRELKGLVLDSLTTAARELTAVAGERQESISADRKFMAAKVLSSVIEDQVEAHARDAAIDAKARVERRVGSAVMEVRRAVAALRTLEGRAVRFSRYADLLDAACDAPDSLPPVIRLTMDEVASM